MILILGAVCCFILLNPKYQDLKYRTFRTLTFVGTGLSWIALLVHGVRLFGIEKMMKQFGMPCYFLERLLLAIGAAFYGTRIPESK
ncbi:uncharacterized protein DFL_007880 [Arthrobotrys flagrans]|uniref:Ferric oxidoreductase domain-containing protein n=1 Tax=Arthrobotrys flagrans TaxID=97331 RepID=A0A436ZXR4_ARTFL|nr:hypothetical protein DFL_007880 [Arthrobotrys flagrans]